MIEDIDLGYISTVVVKDLSRLGRRYDTVGYYTDTYFPDRDVRFIAINDNVDSDEGENEIAPFKNIINEWYAKDISKSVDHLTAFGAAPVSRSACRHTDI